MGPILADPTKGSTALSNKDLFFLGHISKESSGFGFQLLLESFAIHVTLDTE